MQDGDEREGDPRAGESSEHGDAQEDHVQTANSIHLRQDMERRKEAAGLAHETCRARGHAERDSLAGSAVETYGIRQ